MLAGLLILLGSMAIVGPEGLRAQYETLHAMSAFRDVDPIIAPQWMINWRGLLASFLPEDVTDRTGKLITVVLSIATVGLLPLVWRGPWDPRSERFAIQMLATVLVMMLASYHNHIHSAALLLIPGLAVAAQRKRPRDLVPILLTGLYAPLPLYFARASMMSVTWLFIALMLAALGIIVNGEVAALVGGEEPRLATGGPDSRESEPATPERLATT